MCFHAWHLRYEDGITEYYGGDGRSEKSVQTTQTISPASGVYSETNYRIWSSVLGQPLTLVGDTGKKVETNVYAGGAVIGAQRRAPNGNESVGWTAADPVTGSRCGRRAENQQVKMKISILFYDIIRDRLVQIVVSLSIAALLFFNWWSGDKTITPENFYYQPVWLKTYVFLNLPAILLTGLLFSPLSFFENNFGNSPWVSVIYYCCDDPNLRFAVGSSWLFIVQIARSNN